MFDWKMEMGIGGLNINRDQYSLRKRLSFLEVLCAMPFTLPSNWIHIGRGVLFLVHLWGPAGQATQIKSFNPRGAAVGNMTLWGRGLE